MPSALILKARQFHLRRRPGEWRKRRQLLPGPLFQIIEDLLDHRRIVAQFQRMVNHESGLLGVSGTSSDLRYLLAHEAGDARAADAVALFCYQAKKWIGSSAAALGGLDTLVFAGGIGENAATVRARIGEGLSFLGIKLDQKRNANNAVLISPRSGRVKVRVIRTDEELMIARSVTRVLNLD